MTVLGRFAEIYEEGLQISDDVRNLTYDLVTFQDVCTLKLTNQNIIEIHTWVGWLHLFFHWILFVVLAYWDLV